MDEREEDLPWDRSIDNRADERESQAEESSVVEGRADWFAQRVGQSSDSLSASRLLDATNLAEATATDPRQTLVPVNWEYPGDGEPRVFTFDMDSHPPADDRQAAKDFSEYGTFGPPLIVDKLDAPYAWIVMHISPSKLPDLNLQEAAFVRWHADDEGASIVEAAKYFAADELLVGRITRPGRYQAVTLPRRILLTSLLNDPVLQLGSLFVSYIQLQHLAGHAGQEECLRNLRALQRFIAAAIDSFDSAGDVPHSDQEYDSDSVMPTWLRSLITLTPEAILELENRALFVAPPILNFWRLRVMSANQWESIGPSSPERLSFIGRVKQIDVHPYDGRIVIAAAAGGGVWRTDDEGQHWCPLMQNEPSLTMGAVAFAPSNPDIIYAASGEDGGFNGAAWPGLGVYRGVDGGRSWVRAANMTSTRFSAVMVHPTLPHTIYVAGNKGLHKSIDGGQSWIRNPGLDSLYDGHVTDVVIDYDEPDNVYIGVYNVGVLRSRTAGESIGGAPAFTPMPDPKLPRDVEAEWVKLAIGRNGEHRSRFIAAKLGPQGARLFTTKDGGDTWTEKNGEPGTGTHSDWASVIAVDPFDENKLLTGASPDNLRVSIDGGSKWRCLPSTHEDYQDIAFDPRDSRRIYAANDAGVFISRNGGTSWCSASGDLIISQVYDLDISQSNCEIVACGTQDVGVFYRNERGIWSQNSAGDVPQVGIDPSNPKILYFAHEKAISTADQNAAAGKPLINIFRSSDGLHTPHPPRIKGSALTGNSPWVTVIKLIPDPKRTNPLENRKMFVCGTSQLFYSHDAGSSFEVVREKSGCPFLFRGTITALEYAPSNPLVLYLGTSEGFIYRSEDGGQSGDSWARLTQNIFASPVSAISIAASNPDRVWVAFAGTGVSRTARPNELRLQRRSSFVFKSKNGRTFVDASGQLPNQRLPEIPISAIAIEIGDRECAYVGTDVGVFRTSDGGDTWSAFQEGLPRAPVTELLLHYAGRILFAATMGRGVYRRRLE